MNHSNASSAERFPIREFLTDSGPSERLVWRHCPRFVGDDWEAPMTYEHGQAELVVSIGDVTNIVWPRTVSPTFSDVAYEPPAQALRRWQRFEGLPVSFNLAHLEAAGRASDIGASLIGIDNFSGNPLVETDWRGWKLVFPSLTLFSAMVAPHPTMLEALMSPTGVGIKLDAAATTKRRLVLTRTYKFPLSFYKPRAFECLGFWLGNSRRRHALRHTYHSIRAGDSLALPAVNADIQMIADGYTDGQHLVVQRLGAARERRVWPRTWEQLLIRDAEGRDRVLCSSKSEELALSPSIKTFGIRQKS